MVFATSLVVFLLLCYMYCRYFDETFTASCLPLLWLYLGNSQVSVYRTIGHTLVVFLSDCTILSNKIKMTVILDAKIEIRNKSSCTIRLERRRRRRRRRRKVFFAHTLSEHVYAIFGDFKGCNKDNF